MIRLLTTAALLMLATSAHAQSVPPITRSKEVATKAANAASNRVRTQEAVTSETPSAGQTNPPAGRPNPTAGRPNPTAGRPTTNPGRAPAQSGRPTTAMRDTTTRAGVDSVRPESPETTKELVLMREVYRYDQGARRDPFVSLMESGDLRPVPADLRLIGVIYDPTGRRSLATLRDVTTQELYRVAVGNVLGRTRITHIQPKQITMTIEEFGFSRQLVLILGDTTDTRIQR